MLEIRNLTCGYDSKFCLKEINLVVKEKEFIGVIGPNGSGKTTLIRAVTKVIKPQGGNIFWNRKNIATISFKELVKEIAVVSQNPDIEPKMRVEEFVLLGRIPHRKKWQFLETSSDEEIAYESMVLTDTLRFKERDIESLSGGEKQLVVIARALAQKPNLLLLDEPTSHLDITQQLKILDLLKRLNRKNGITIIVVLHDLNLASEYCQRLVLINEGRICRIGNPDEVLDYRIIEEVYRTIVIVEKNPISSKPYILIIPEEERQKRESII